MIFPTAREFISAFPPFNALTPTELDFVANALKTRKFDPNETIIGPNLPVTALFIIAEGSVQECYEEAVIAAYGPQDTFDALALFDPPRHTFRTRETLHCYELPTDCFHTLCQQNLAFYRYFFQTLTLRLNHLIARHNQQELSTFMMAKVGDAYYRPPIYIDADATIYEAVTLMKSHKISSLLIRKPTSDQPLIGMVSDSDIREHVILRHLSVDTAIGNIGVYSLIGLQKQDFLFNAKTMMTRHGVKRLVVFDGQQIDGILDQIDLFSYFSDHSRLIAVQAERATTLEELKRASQGLITMIRVLSARGIKVHYLAEMVTDLNRKIFQKLYDLIVPPKLGANACFIVMGSEGRAEQILKTDQDNAMILRDGYDHPRLEDIALKLTDTLVSFGYPRCEGNIMVSNPFWCQSFQNFKRNIDRWIDDGTEEDLMNLAIFYDATTVAGDDNLLRAAKAFLFNRLRDHPGFYARFARPTLSFPTPLGFFETFVVEKSGPHKNQLDLKKGGIFPIVQGIRSLALEARLDETNTLARIKALEAQNRLDRDFAVELAKAYNDLSTLRLTSELEQFSEEGQYDSYITPSQLNKVDRDDLRDAFRTVNSFKKLITHHFRLNLLG